MMDIKTVISILIIISFFLSSISLATDSQWQKITRSIFVVYFQVNDLQNSEKILNSLQSSYLRLSQEIGVELVDSVVVFITPSKEVFQKMVGENIPQWSDGIAAPIHNTIILKSPRWIPSETDNKAIATHELTHIILARAVKGNPIPRWFNEGLAVYYSGEKGYASSTLVSKALLTDSIIPLNDIDEVLQFHVDKAQLAYQESYLAIDYLMNQYGSDSVKKIIQKLGDGLNLNQALLRVIDLDLWEFEDEWLDYIKRKYRWHFMIEFDNYLWVLILALFIIGFIIMRRRNKKTIQRWQMEDDTTEL